MSEKVRIDVVASSLDPRIRALLVDDTRVTDIKASPGYVVESFVVDRKVLQEALNGGDE